MPIGDTEPPPPSGFPLRRADRVALWSLIGLTLLTRVLAATIWSADAETDPDAYVGIAKTMAIAGEFCVPGTNTPTAYRPPLYPYVLAVPLLDDPEKPLADGISNFNTIFAVLLCVVTMGFAALLQSRIGLLVAAAIVALDPLLIRATPLAMTEPLFTLLTTYAVWMLVASETVWSSPFTGERFPPAPSPPSSGERVGVRGRALVSASENSADHEHRSERSTPSPYPSPPKTGERGPEGNVILGRVLLPHTRLLVGIAAGIFLGLAALCRPTIWPFIGLYSLGLIAAQRRHLRDIILPLATMWLVIAAVVSPWVIRNQLVMGHPILTTTHGGYTLLLGNNPVFYDEVARQPWGTVWDGGSLDRWQRGMLAEMDADLGPTADEVARDRWQAARAWRHITDDPAGFGWAVWYRVRSLWSLSPRGKGGESLPGVVRWLVAAWYAALFGFAIAGAVIWWRERRPGLWVLLLFIASVQMMHLVYWTDTRMRAPLHPVLAVLAATAVERWWRWRGTREAA